MASIEGYWAEITSNNFTGPSGQSSTACTKSLVQERYNTQDGELSGMSALLPSVKAMARFLTVYINGCKWFESRSKFASYIGIASFPNTSGTGLTGRTKVNRLANKEGKTLLNMCASSTIQNGQEMKRYDEMSIIKWRP
jgi:hypothetical protein